MVAAGLLKYEKLPGEWYGPGTACYVLRDLVLSHEKKQKQRYVQLQKQRQQQFTIINKGDIKTTTATTTNNNYNGTKQKQNHNLHGQCNFDRDKSVFRVHVASQGSIYKDEIFNLMTKDARKRYEKKQQ